MVGAAVLPLRRLRRRETQAAEGSGVHREATLGPGDFTRRVAGVKRPNSEPLTAAKKARRADDGRVAVALLVGVERADSYDHFYGGGWGRHFRRRGALFSVC